jgi:hypothetical protein
MHIIHTNHSKLEFLSIKDYFYSDIWLMLPPKTMVHISQQLVGHVKFYGALAGSLTFVLLHLKLSLSVVFGPAYASD